uniref:Uncharacterized protein n=1 Tax=Avena sativa TaxID=4498 RepID=A0ACD5Y8Y6_AVESA
MGIVKAASGVATVQNGNTREREESLLLQSSPSQESDGCEQAEVDCELAMSRGQVCNIPYGLYDLPELKDILSLETWNLCLTEDDRLHLAAYLPDMDQHDLFTTLTDLFSGSAMFFGRPLRGFFDRLSGGFYSPDVSQSRELLMNFQRRRYYHFLKLYHDGMVWKFACMNKLWRSGVSTSLEEKIHIWHNWKHEKLLIFADPSCSPMNASLPISGEAESASSSLLKRAKLMKGTSTTDWSAKDKEIVHRAKSMETSSSRSHTFQTAGLIPLTHLGVQVSTFSPYASSQHIHNFPVNPSYPYYMNTNRSSLGSSSSNPWQWEGALETYPVLVKGPSAVQHAILEELKRGNRSAMLRGYQLAAKPSLAYSTEENYTSESPHEKNLLMNFGRQSARIPGSSSDPYTGTTIGHQTNGWTNMPNQRNAEIPTLGGSTNPAYNNFPEHSETIRRYHDGLMMKAPPAMNSVTKAEEDRFPCTYARRKVHRGLDLVDPVKSPSSPSMVGSESASVIASMANVKANAIKL